MAWYDKVNDIWRRVGREVGAEFQLDQFNDVPRLRTAVMTRAAVWLRIFGDGQHNEHQLPDLEAWGATYRNL